MRIIADFQIHSKYSRATSEQMNLEKIDENAKIKGLDLVGTGDFTHPLWLKELKQKLKELDNSGIYKYEKTMFVLSGEICTIYEYENKIRKIHHLILAKNFEVVDQINETLSSFGDLKKDGRPSFQNLTSAEFVERMMEIDKKILIASAHAWTPWFSLFGSKSGFDSIKECYQDQSKNIFCIETGLSSDPSMNWRLSELDNITLISNSDSHSPHPWRLGREANVFELKDLCYDEIFYAIKNKDRKSFLFTIETDPNYGKYHFTGHRKCNISMHPKDAIKLKNICPKCKKKMTIGVLQRVEELADREEGYVPKNAIPFKTLLPLHEIISNLIKEDFNSRRVLEIYNKLIKKFGNEFKILLDIEKERLEEVVDKKVADGILKVREGKVSYIPGYDGVYGKVIFENSEKKYLEQKTLKNF